MVSQMLKAIYFCYNFGYLGAVNLEGGNLMVNKAIQLAIETLGSQKRLADACGVRQPSVWAWLHEKKKASAENAKSIEIATEGIVSAYKVRPDLTCLFPHPNQAA